MQDGFPEAVVSEGKDTHVHGALGATQNVGKFLFILFVGEEHGAVDHWLRPMVLQKEAGELEHQLHRGILADEFTFNFLEKRLCSYLGLA